MLCGVLLEVRQDAGGMLLFGWLFEVTSRATVNLANNFPLYLKLEPYSFQPSGMLLLLLSCRLSVSFLLLILVQSFHDHNIRSNVR